MTLCPNCEKEINKLETWRGFASRPTSIARDSFLCPECGIAVTHNKKTAKKFLKGKVSIKWWEERKKEIERMREIE